jgi:hypothetical protein
MLDDALSNDALDALFDGMIDRQTFLNGIGHINDLEVWLQIRKSDDGNPHAPRKLN